MIKPVWTIGGVVADGDVVSALVTGWNARDHWFRAKYGMRLEPDEVWEFQKKEMKVKVVVAAFGGS